MLLTCRSRAAKRLNRHGKIIFRYTRRFKTFSLHTIRITHGVQLLHETEKDPPKYQHRCERRASV